MRRILADIKEKGTTRESMDQMVTFEDYTNTVGMRELVAMEGKYKVDDFKANLKK
jgi:hypothetical protein